MLQDGPGGARQLLDSSQATVAAYITDAYGNSVSSSGSAANPFKWNGGSGYYSDAESGLQKVGSRYYEPATGRWISQDSLLIAGSPVDGQALNRYAYCEGNPVVHVDPNGHGPGDQLVALGETLLFVGGIILVAAAVLALLAACGLPIVLAAVGVMIASGLALASIAAVCIVAGMNLNYSAEYPEDHNGASAKPQPIPVIPPGLPGATTPH